MGAAYGKVPGGNIKPSRFVKLDPSNTGRCLQCTSGDVVYGIAGPATRRIPFGGLDDGFVGVLGDPNAILIYGPGDTEVYMAVGSGQTVANGDFLKPDTDGAAQTAGTDKDPYGAIALAAGTNGDLIPVQPIIGELSK